MEGEISSVRLKETEVNQNQLMIKYVMKIEESNNIKMKGKYKYISEVWQWFSNVDFVQGLQNLSKLILIVTMNID